jgi:hypothetical protein
LPSPCAAYKIRKWVAGPGMSAADPEPAKARCSLLARDRRGELSVIGSPGYVTGVAIGRGGSLMVTRASNSHNEGGTGSGTVVEGTLSVRTKGIAAENRSSNDTGRSAHTLRAIRMLSVKTGPGCVSRWWRDGADIDLRGCRQADCRRRVYLRRRARRRRHSPETCRRDRAAVRRAIPSRHPTEANAPLAESAATAVR